MTERDRPNPDALLAAIQREEARQQRGKLKVFLGMCAGVGKTYAMLEAARREFAAGREVVIGYLETHGRKETDALAEGLPAIPRRQIEYRGIQLSEFDLGRDYGHPGAGAPRRAVADSGRSNGVELDHGAGESGRPGPSRY